MYFNQATVLALAALLPALSIQSAVLLPRQRGAYCQTSNGSPLTEDITKVINELKDRPADELCRQTNDEGSDCTTLVKHETAAISVCGGVDAEDKGTSCRDVANYAKDIQTQCLKSGLGKSGGQYVISPSLRVEVINSKAT